MSEGRTRLSPFLDCLGTRVALPGDAHDHVGILDAVKMPSLTRAAVRHVVDRAGCGGRGSRDACLGAGFSSFFKAATGPSL